MRAIGFTRSLEIDHPEALECFEVTDPIPQDTDVLVRVEGISFNPLDVKMRQRSAVDIALPTPKVLGWDGCGTVISTGSDADKAWMGRRVLFTGDITRPGCNAEYLAIDSRGIAAAPDNLTAAEAASLPLTGVTAYEALHRKLEIGRSNAPAVLLIIGGAGGVGSMAIQLAKCVENITVVATASRSESREWCLALGADHVIDHTCLSDCYGELNLDSPSYILNCANTEQYWVEMSELINVRGHICSVVENYENIDLKLLMRKSATFSWEHMNTSQLSGQPPTGTATALDAISALIDKGSIRTTTHHTLYGLTVDNVRAAHKQLESGSGIGKIVLQVASK
jgi:NADPH2:quinone reductase